MTRAVLGSTSAVARSYTPDARAWLRDETAGLAEDDAKRPAVRAIRSALRCQTVRILSTCRSEGHKDRDSLNHEDRLVTCPHCAAADLELKREAFLRTWPGRITVVTARYLDKRDPATTSARAFVDLRAAVRRATGGDTWDPGDWRWVVGYDHLLYLGLGSSYRHTSLVLASAKARLDAEGVEVTVEELDREPAVDRVLETWASPHRAWVRLVEARDFAACLAFPWIQHGKENPLVRTASSVPSSFPWASRRKSADEANSKAIDEERDGVDFAHCACVLPDGTRCGKPNEYHMVHKGTGIYLGFTQEFPTQTLIRKSIDLREGSIRSYEINGKRDVLPEWLERIAAIDSKRPPPEPPPRHAAVWELPRRGG